MIRQDCLEEVMDFIKLYPNAVVCKHNTIMDGYVSCIKPIPTICGAELLCSPNTYHSVRRLLGENTF